MSLRTFKTLVKENKAPRGAKYIGIFKKNREEGAMPVKKIDITGTGLEDKTNDEQLLYSFGVLSDIHMRANPGALDYPEGKTEAQADFENAIKCFEESGVSFVCACGDWGIDGRTELFYDNKQYNADWEAVRDKLSDTGITIPVFTCLGNHDTYTTAFPKQTSSQPSSNIVWINRFWVPFMFYTNEGRNENIKNILGNNGKILFQESGTTENIVVWDGEDDENGFADRFDDGNVDSTNVGIVSSGNTVPVTGSFYFEKTNRNGKGEIISKDVFIFFSLYNSNQYESGENYNKNDSEYNKYTNINWLRNILETHRNDRCFVFTHFPFGRKAGNLYGAKEENGTDSRIGDKIYHYNFTLVPDNFYNDRKKEWVRLNILNNHYKNSIWFSGHTHYKWKYQKYFRLTNVRNSDPGYTNSDKPKQNLEASDSAYNVHLPSCAYPRDVIDVDLNQRKFIENGEDNRYDDWNDSEGAIVRVYEDRIEVLGVSFKIGAGVDEGDSVYPNRQWDGGNNRNKNWEDLYHNKIAPIAKYSIPTNTVNFTGETTDVFETNAVYIDQFN